MYGVIQVLGVSKRAASTALASQLQNMSHVVKNNTILKIDRSCFNIRQ